MHYAVPTTFPVQVQKYFHCSIDTLKSFISNITMHASNTFKVKVIIILVPDYESITWCLKVDDRLDSHTPEMLYCLVLCHVFWIWSGHG